MDFSSVLEKNNYTSNNSRFQEAKISVPALSRSKDSFRTDSVALNLTNSEGLTIEKQYENVFGNFNSPRNSNASTNLEKCEKTLSDGSMEINYSNGNDKTISADGQLVTIKYFNGEVKETNLKEKIIRYPASKDNIDKAKKKLKKCEETSDIYSSDSDLNSSLRVRKRFSTRRFISGCSSSEEDEPIGKLPRPPALLKPTEGGSNSHQISRQILSRTLTEESNKTRNTPNTPIINKNALLKTTFGSRENFSLSLTQEDDLTLTPNNGQVLNESNRSITVSANGLEKIFQEVKRLREELKEVKGFLIKSRNSSVVFSLPNDTPVEFPLTTIANLQTLEEYLSEEDKFNDLASYFSTLGGNATNTQVNKILRFVMSDSLATKYNFAGQRNKQAFGGTKINSVIIRAIQIKFPATTRADIENAVKTWLKHAKQRMEKKQKTILE